MEFSEYGLLATWLGMLIGGGVMWGKTQQKLKQQEEEQTRLRRIQDGLVTNDQLNSTSKHHETLSKNLAERVDRVERTIERNHEESQKDIKQILRALKNGG